MTTLLTLLEGLARYLGWWARALIRWRDPRAPMSGRRAAFLVAAMPIFLAVQAIHALCLLLDEVLFPGYRRVRIDEAVFITGIPRSGTTFLHRSLAADTDRFTSLTTWEAVLAPSVTQRRLVQVLAGIDRVLGGHARRGLDALTRRLTGELDAVHEVGLSAAEEDYLALLPAGGCFIVLLAFPGAGDLQMLGHLDRWMPAGRRRRLLAFYRGCLQRHVYADGGRRMLLSKNAAFGSWLQGLGETFPNARFIVCIREPAAALSSQISAVGAARSLFGTRVDSAAFQALFVEVFADTLDHLAETLERWPAERAVVVDMADLGSAPAEIPKRALGRLGLAPDRAAPEHDEASSGEYRSAHRHDPDALAIPREELDARMSPAYRRLLNGPHRIRMNG